MLRSSLEQAVVEIISLPYPEMELGAGRAGDGSAPKYAVQAEGPEPLNETFGGK